MSGLNLKILVLTALLLEACALSPVAPPPMKPEQRVLDLGQVIRIHATPAIESGDRESYDSQEQFGPITEFDAISEGAFAYEQQLGSQARELGIDFCDWQIPGYRLETPCRGTDSKSGANENAPLSVAYGDFDGDGQADAFGAYVAEGPANPNRILSLVWFGGESAPRAFYDLKDFFARKGVRYTEENVEAAMTVGPKPLSKTKSPKKYDSPSSTPPSHGASPSPTAKPLWREVPILVSTCHGVAPPQVKVTGNVNTFYLKRAILGLTACNLYQTIIVFSKLRDRILSAQASSM